MSSTQNLLVDVETPRFFIAIRTENESNSSQTVADQCELCGECELYFRLAGSYKM